MKRNELYKILKIGIIITFILFLINLIFYLVTHNYNYNLWLLNIAKSFVFSFVFTFVNIRYYYYVGKFLGWNKHATKTLIISIIGLIPLNFVVFSLLTFFTNYLTNNNLDWHFLFQKYYFNQSVFVIFLAVFIAITIVIGHFIKLVGEQKLTQEILKTQLHKSKFESLKSQLNPHFLFNSLNVLTSLIGENSDKAENFVVKLAKIYRYVLESDKMDTVPLINELEFSKNYLELMKMRFEDNFIYQLPDDIPEKRILPLSLQIVLENIFKHNDISEKKPLQISIYIEDNYLIVKNNKTGNIIKNNKTEGIGLKNIVMRYELFKLKLEIINNNDNFFVKLPLL